MLKDLNFVEITLHPHASDILFKHYQILMKLFSDVLGLLEIDYLGISIINQNKELLFFSSHPSIERNLIEHNLWQRDPCHFKDFFNSNKMQFWDEIYKGTENKILLYYRQEIHKFKMGMAIPCYFDNYKVSYSFGFKDDSLDIKNTIKTNLDQFIHIGRFCLQNILQAISFPKTTTSPQLKLIINKALS